MKKKLIISLLTSLIAFNLVSCGANKNETATSEGSKINIEELKSKYASTEKASYSEPLYNLERNHTFKIPMSKDIYEKNKDNLTSVIGVYLDANSKMEIKATMTYDEKTEELLINAPNVPVFYNEEDFDKSRVDISVDDFDVSTSREYDFDWGNGNNYYLIQKNDLKTGEALAKPNVTLFTIKPELNTPTVQVSLNNKGIASLKWNPIEGANKYIIYSINEDSNRKSYSLHQIAETKQTSFEGFLGAVVDFNEMVVSTNAPFDTTKDSVQKFCVMAVSEDKKSLISNIIDPINHASNIPVGVDYDKNSTIDKGDALSDFPTHLYVKMGDGSSILTPVDFDTEYAKFVDNEKHGLVIEVRYKYRGTSLVSKHLIKVDKEDDVIKQEALTVLKTLQERQEKIQWNGLNGDVDVNIDSTPPKDMPPTDTPKETPKDSSVSTSEKVHASTALGEFIALNMLSGNEKINIADFPEASNKDVLLDSFYEALYQNPLVMTVNKVGYDYTTSELLVEYGQTSKELKEKQETVKKEVDKVVKEIITDSMTPLEKEFAINKYLCDTATYDVEALKNAEENNMETVDPKFNDSFTPYGVLVNKVGVCASYAGAFKLLADASGLESIVVTGNLNGSLPHAWNRVLIEDHWMTLDSTNNDNETIPNALLNLPDINSKTVLIEDDKYALDDTIDKFKGEKDTFEFYKVSNKYFDKSEKEKAALELANQLKDNTLASIRTNIDISEKEAAEIVAIACQKANIEAKNASLWIGVISIEK